MEYSNPEIPEGINTSKQHPLKDFFILTAGVLGGIILIVIVISQSVEHLAIYIPFSIEQKLLSGIDLTLEDEQETSPEIQEYIDQLTAKLLPNMDMPEDITVNVKYIDSPVQNAFATVGGHISIYRGLVNLLPSENALAMVIAHEIAHIKHRDPIVAMGRGVAIGLFLAAITGSSTDRYVGSVINETGTLTVLGFNRKQERLADASALQALENTYGHVAGADTLFKTFQKLEQEEHMNKVPEFFSTHPLSDKRIREIQQLASKNNWSTEGEPVPLPPYIINQDQSDLTNH